MRTPLGVLATVLCLAACAPSTGGEDAASEPIAATEAPTETGEPTPAAKATPVAESDDCRVSVTRPGVSSLRIETAAVRRDCVRPALLRVRVKRAVPGDDPVVKSGATRDDRIALKLPCEPGTYYAVATDYRGRTARSKAVRLTCPTPTPTPTATPTPTPTSTPSEPQPSRTTEAPEKRAPASSVGTAVENEVVRLTNAERAKGGCGPLKHDARLREAAIGHSTDMADNDYFDHTSQDGRDMTDRINATGFSGSAWAENIAMGQPTAAAVVKTWMDSDGHRENIMNCDYTLIGVGAAKNSQGQIYWTQDFAAP